MNYLQSCQEVKTKPDLDSPLGAQKFFDAHFTPTGEIYNWEAYFDSVEEMIRAVEDGEI